MIFKILGFFANTLTAGDKYSLLKSDNLTPPIQIHLSKNQNSSAFFFFFLAVLKSRLNFVQFEIKDDPHS